MSEQGSVQHSTACGLLTMTLVANAYGRRLAAGMHTLGYVRLHSYFPYIPAERQMPRAHTNFRQNVRCSVRRRAWAEHR